MRAIFPAVRRIITPIAISAALLTISTAPAMPQAMASTPCRPMISVANERDQSGEWQQVKFETSPGCAGAQIPVTVRGWVYCHPNVKTVYQAADTHFAPVQTSEGRLPSSAECPSFVASAEVRIYSQTVSDNWTWESGNYPA